VTLTGYQKYKEIKGAIRIRHKGISVNRLIATSLSPIFQGKMLPKFGDYKHIIFQPYFIEVIDKPAEFFSTTKLITYLRDRQDYIELINGYHSLIPDAIVKQVKLKTRKIKYSNPLPLIYLCQVLLQLIITKELKADFKQLVWLSIQITRTKLTINYYLKLFRKKKFALRKYYCFNSSYHHEAILCSVFNKIGIQTTSFVHGVYVNYKRNIPFDVINYENVCAKEVWTWGTSADWLFREHNPDTILVCKGNPKYKGYWKEARISQLKDNKILVLLGRDIYQEGNHKLLQIISNYKNQHSKTEVHVKLHPSLKLSDYTGYRFPIITDKTFKDIIGTYDFTITYNTNAYLETYLCNKISFRYTYLENEDFQGFEGDKFSSIEELSNLIKVFKGFAQNELKEIINKVTEHNFNLKQ
jgi:hypothetical protein